MNPLADQQEKLAVALEASEWFTGATVFRDDGNQDDAIEAELCGSGFAAVVSLPVAASFPSSTPAKTAHAPVVFAVELHLSPARNAEQATPRDMMEGINAAVVALLGSGELLGRQQWEPVEFSQVPADPGLLSYVITVQTRAVFQAA